MPRISSPTATAPASYAMMLCLHGHVFDVFFLTQFLQNVLLERHQDGRGLLAMTLGIIFRASSLHR